jgi:outer membrane biosynthesis protein TonB
VTSAPTPALTVVVTQAPTPEPTQEVTPPPTSLPTPNPSNAPTSPPTTASLQLEVTFSGRGSPPNALPKCHGDCDDDSQCEGSLVCFQRTGTEAVPGCSGTGANGVDYCAERPTENTVWPKGNNGSPAISFPLGLCEGDCDSDAECQPGLICQQRSGTEAIPGCIGDPKKWAGLLQVS